MIDKLKFIIINYLNKEYSGLVRYETNEWKNFIFFMKDGKVIFNYNKKNGVIYISYDNIWSFLESFFGLEYEEIQSLTKEWVEELFKSEVTTTTAIEGKYSVVVEEQFKLEVTTTRDDTFTKRKGVEELFKLETNDR